MGGGKGEVAAGVDATDRLTASRRLAAPGRLAAGRTGLQVGEFHDQRELGAGLCGEAVAGPDGPADKIQQGVGPACHIRAGVCFAVGAGYGFR